MYNKYCEEDLREFRYEYVEDGVKVVAYSGVKDNVRIPTSVDGTPVVELGINKDGYVGIMPYNVLIPNTVKRVNVYAICSPQTHGWFGGSSNENKGWFTEFSLEEGNPNLAIINGMLIEGGKRVVYCMEHSISQVIIPDGIESIGEYAFRDCSKLSEVVLPDGLKHIEDYAFAGCQIKSIVLPDGLEEIGYSAFYNKFDNYNDRFTLDLTIPTSVKKISVCYTVNLLNIENNDHLTISDGFLMTSDKKTALWYLGESVPELFVPDYVENIAPYACSVWALSEIKKLSLGTSLKTISAHAFRENKVKTLRIPESLVEIDDTAFNFSNVTSVIVDKKNPTVYTDKTALYKTVDSGKLVLMYCFRDKIEEYVVAENTVSILDGAFVNCKQLKELTLPDSLVAFSERCLGSSVKKVKIPAAVTHMEFRQEHSGIKYEISNENNVYAWIDHVLYKKTDDGLIAVRFDGAEQEVILAPGTIAVASYAFNKKVKKVTFASSVKRVEHHAFYSCAIEEVIFNEGLEFIDYVAFARNRINEVVLPSTIKYVCTSAFYYCPIQKYAIADGAEVYAVQDDALYSKDLATLYDVPEQCSISEFCVAQNTTDICRAFRGCKKIKAIKLPASVKNIWKFAIIGCKALKDVYFEASPDYISEDSIDFDFPISLHAELDSSVADMIENLRSKTDGRTSLDLAVKGMENIQSLSKDFMLMPNKTGLTILKNKSKKKNIVVPAQIGNYNVSAIGAYAFSESNWGSEILESVELPDTIETMGKGVFFGCRKLTAVTLPKGITKIAESTFHYCAELEEVNIPEGVTKIEQCAFFGCEKLSKITLPQSIDYISEWIFSDKAENSDDGRYKDLYLNARTLFVVEKGSYAEKFLRSYTPDKYDCERLAVVYANQMNAPISKEETEALKYLDYTIEEDGTVSVCCQSYWQEPHPIVKIPETIQGMPVTKLTGMGSIHGSIEVIHIPASILSIEGLYYLSFYSGGQNMREIVVAEDNPNYWSDGKALYTKDKTTLVHMFDYQAEEYVIHENTKTIGKEAFGKFSNLKKLVLPEGLKEIQSGAFYDCGNLAEIIGVEKVSSVAEGVLSPTAYYRNMSIVFSGTVLQKYNSTTEKSYTIPNGTTEIASNAFYLYNVDDALEEIIIPETVKIIGKSAFQGRKHLVKINIPEGVEAIESSTFKGCEALTSLHIPASVSSIAVDAFPVYEKPWRGAPIIPVFAAFDVDENNATYKSVNGILYSKDESTLIKVPASFSEEEFVAADTLKIIGEHAFEGNSSIKRVVLTSNVTCVSTSAFAHCASLEEINLENVSTIEKNAFYECEKLRSIVLNATEIGSSAFSSCKKLSSVTLQNTNVIGSYAFNECAELKSINLPDGLVEIGEHAFAKCGLTDVIVPKTVLKTGNESFSGCKTITIYDTIDPDAKPADAYMDDVNGSPNSVVGFIGIGPAWAMWQCAANHNWVDHEIIVRSAETGEIKYKVWMGSDPKQRKYYCTLTSSWGKNATFNFGALDAAFSGIKGVEHKIKVALNRLRYPENLSDGQRDSYVAYLVRSAKDLITSCIDSDDMETLLYCEPFGVIKKNNIDDLLEYAAKAKAIQFSAYLMEYKATHFGGSTIKKPTLSFKEVDPWATSKSAPNKVGRYKGNDVDVVFPTEVKGVTITGVAGTTSKVPENYRAIVSVSLPEGYTTIGDYAFYGCENLERINLPSTIQSIGKDAFNGCVKLKEIIMPDTVTEIGENAFRNCSALENVKFSKNLTAIPGYAFAGCSSLREIDLPKNISRIYKGCFESYGIRKVTVHCAKMWSTGQCFGSAPEVHAYKDAMKGVYGISQRSIHNLKLVDLLSETFVTVTISYTGEQDAIFNFYADAIDSSIQKTGSAVLDEKLTVSVEGNSIVDVLTTVYGADFISAENNADEIHRLSEFNDTKTIVTIMIKEEKKNDDGAVTTVYEFSTKKHKGTLKEKEVIGSESDTDNEHSHRYMDYYDYYHETHDENRTDEEPASESQDDGFVNIEERELKGDSGIWDFSVVDAIEFEGKIFVLTGFGAQEEEKITQEIQKRGGTVKSSTVVKTDYLIVMEDYDHATSKYQKAKELQAQGKNVAIISSKMFYSFVE